jgi:short-subunit dehydrogenase
MAKRTNMPPRREDHFAGKLVVITGGTSGIGLALAKELLNLRARTVVLSDKADSVSSAIAQLNGTGRAVEGYVCDVGSPEAVAEVCARISTKYGAPDILINNAGFAIYRTVEQEEWSEVERLMSVNFAGPIRVTKAFLGGMVQRGSGHIVNIASIAGALPLTPCAVYGAAKHGMMGWSKCLAPEVARFGIDVTVVCPGRVETSFFNHETFQRRPHRKETEMTVPMETVVDVTLDAILRRQSLRYVPRYYGLIAWAYNALGPLVRYPFDRIMQSRIEDLYRSSGGQ